MMFGYETSAGVLLEIPGAQIDGIADWEWSADSDSYKITQPVYHDFDVTLEFHDRVECDKILALMDEDTMDNNRGRLVMGDWSISCNAIKGTFSMRAGDICEYKVQFRAYGQRWVRSNTMQFMPSASGSGGVDYPHDYPFDFAPPPSGVKTISVDSFGKCDFRIVVYGEAVNPSITIGGHIYKVNATIASGELLFINQVSKGLPGAEIFKRSSTRTITNLYDSREKSSYIFEKISPGENMVQWSGTFGFDLTVYESRSKIPDDRY